MESTKKVLCSVAFSATILLAHGGWVVNTETNPKTLSDEETGWSFNVTVANTTDLTLTAITGGAGDLDLRNLPGGCRVVAFGTIFKGSTTLTSFCSDSTLDPLARDAFYQCSVLTNWVGGLAEGKDLDEQHKETFWGSKALVRLEMSGVKYLPNYFCHDCSSLKVAHLPDATSINSSFGGCTSLTDLVCNWDEMTAITGGFPPNMECDLRLPEATEVYLKSCPKVTSVYAPKLQVLKDRAFVGCDSLTNFVGGGELTTVTGVSQFWGLSKLEGALSFPKLEIVSETMFSGCSKLQSLSLTNATIIGSKAFEKCSSLTNFEISCEKVVMILNFPACPATADCKDLYFPNVTNLGGFASVQMTSINLPKVQTLQGAAFRDCTSLTNFIGGLELVTIAGKDVFWNCPKLTGTITWPKLKSYCGNTMNDSKVQSVDLSSLESFERLSGITSGWLCPVYTTNVIFGPVSSIPNGLLASSTAVGPCHVHFLGPEVPTFESKAFDNPDTKISRFYIHDRGAVEKWRAVCLQLKSAGGTYGKYFYDAQGRCICPRRTIGIVNATGHDPSGYGYAYAIDATPSGLMILLK